MSPQSRSINIGNHRRKKNQLLQRIQKIVDGQSFCSIGCVECHGSKPRTSSSSPTIEPIMIPEPAKLLKDADERIVPRAIWQANMAANV